MSGRGFARVAAAAAVAAGVAAAPSQAAPAADPGRVAAPVARTWIAAVNRGDLAGAVAVVAPNAVFDIGGTRYRGRREIRGWIRGDMLAQRGRYTVLRVRIEPRAAVLTLDFRAGSLQEALRYRFVTNGRLIQTLTARYR
jgi:SnoaL-like domain